MSKIDDLLAEEGAAAENYETSEQLPGHIQVSRPNLGRGTVVSVRLSANTGTCSGRPRKQICLYPR